MAHTLTTILISVPIKARIAVEASSPTLAITVYGYAAQHSRQHTIANKNIYRKYPIA
ncbi:MAG: hypothetical protein IJE73_07515 [Muribaculaceae bacterium]|nr:hypothetical protein [Muribaculaceae bacterium]